MTELTSAALLRLIGENSDFFVTKDEKGNVIFNIKEVNNAMIKLL